MSHVIVKESEICPGWERSLQELFMYDPLAMKCDPLTGLWLPQTYWADQEMRRRSSVRILLGWSDVTGSRLQDGVSIATGQCDPFTRNCGNTGDAWQSNLTTDALMLGEIPNLCD